MTSNPTDLGTAAGPGEAPLVSIGMPVFNGEDYLAEAIESVLGQSFTDLELIICDNASTDGTAAIAERYARADPRVRYVRNPSNLGAAPNYNRAFELSRGRLFKWLAHDDRLSPDYLARTVAVMQARPELVLCNTAVDVINEAGRVIGSYGSVLDQVDQPSVADRFAVFVLQPHTGVDIFGLMRRDALLGSVLHPSFHGADRALLAQLALRGPMLQLPERMHQIREHARRYTRRATSSRFRAAWHEAGRRAKTTVPILELYAAYASMLRHEPLRRGERISAWLSLARWWFVNWNFVRVLVDLAALPLPGLVGVAESVKTRVAGAAPGHFHVVGKQSGQAAGERD